MYSKLTFFLTFLFFVSNVSSQQRVCNASEFTNKKMTDTNFQKNYEERQLLFQNKYDALNDGLSEKRMEAIIIPVAVHFPTATEDLRECLVNLAKDQVRILNEDFSAMNEDHSKWVEATALYPNVNSGTIDVKFILATKNHPENTDEDLLEGEPAVTIGWEFNSSDSDPRWEGYQNFVVKPLSGGVLGYSLLGGDPASGDAVVMTNFAFGSGPGCSGFSPGAPFNLGRTVTHELGHHYNLEHTWGGGTCTSDDGVNDTPSINAPTYGCAEPGSVTMCGNTSLTTNYMDYVDDACMFMFTEGQAARMNAYINVIKSGWKTDVTENSEEPDTDPDPVTDEGLSIFPNPVNDKINILFPLDKIDALTYSLHNLLGKRIFDESIEVNEGDTGITVNTSQLANGIYILNFNTSLYSKTKKIVVNR